MKSTCTYWFFTDVSVPDFRQEQITREQAAGLLRAAVKREYRMPGHCATYVLPCKMKLQITRA